MNLAHTNDGEFIQKLTEIVESNLGDEKFGVDELVRITGLSPHIVRQRLKTISQKTISQFMNEIRLQRSMELLQPGTLTASEVAYRVGFGSATYFNNCFRDFYGYPPGEVKKRGSIPQDSENAGPEEGENTTDMVKGTSFFRRKPWIIAVVLSAVAVLAFVIFFVFFQ